MINWVGAEDEKRENYVGIPKMKENNVVLSTGGLKL
jgi:hypothetical protein